MLLLVMPAQAELEDPTRPPGRFGVVEQDSTESSWSLTSILVSPERRVAIINGKTVRAGDRLGKARVVTIRQTEVLIDIDGETMSLKLLPTRVKTSRDGKNTGK